VSAAKAPTSSNARAAVVFDSHYTIKKGDTLGKISSLYGINPISLAEANDIGLNTFSRSATSKGADTLKDLFVDRRSGERKGGEHLRVARIFESWALSLG
jgi:hypothetical protein